MPAPAFAFPSYRNTPMSDIEAHMRAAHPNA